MHVLPEHEHVLSVAIGATNHRTRLLLENLLEHRQCGYYAVLASPNEADVDILDATQLPPVEFWTSYRQNPQRHKIVITTSNEHGGLDGAHYLYKPIEAAALVSILKKLGRPPPVSVAESAPHQGNVSFVKRMQYFRDIHGR